MADSNSAPGSSSSSMPTKGSTGLCGNISQHTTQRQTDPNAEAIRSTITQLIKGTAGNMKIISGTVLLAAVAVAALAATVSAKDYTVGGSDQWDTYIDYDKWTAGKKFMVGDTITFEYMPYHNVLEVTAADYASCNAGSPISTHSGGSTAFKLTAPGTRYFICGIPRHCLNGTMHVKITTVPYDAAAAAATADAHAPTASSPAQAPLQSPPADAAYAPGPAGHQVALGGTAGKSPAGAPSNAPRYGQPVAAVAGLALAALVALVA